MYSKEGMKGRYTHTNEENKDIIAKSITVSCNLDSLDSIRKFMKTVYTTITPKCYALSGRLKVYGNKERNNRATLFTIPKQLLQYIFGDDVDIPDPDNIDITYYFDKNILRKTEDKDKEEIFILMKITKKLNNSD